MAHLDPACQPECQAVAKEAIRPRQVSIPSARFMRVAKRSSIRSLIFALVCLMSVGRSQADTLTGTVKDPSGAVVTGARIEITGGGLSQAVVLTTDAEGKFSAPNLGAGKYSVRVSKDGFEDRLTAIDLEGTADLPVELTIASQQTSVNVTDKAAAFANSDEVYRQLRDIGVSHSYHCENVTLPMDVGTFEFKSGTITLLGIVNRYETGAIFVGQGHFTLKPAMHIDKEELKRRAGSETVDYFPRLSAPGSRHPRKLQKCYSAGEARCGAGMKYRKGSLNQFWKIRRLTTSTRTFWRRSTTRSTHHSAMLT
jgi:hypothetical protein